MERTAEAVPAHAREHREGGQGSNNTGEGDGGDARADDVRRVPAQGGRGPGLWREVEGDHVEEGVEDLRGWVSIGFVSEKCGGLWLTSNNTAVEVVMGGGASAGECMSVLSETGTGSL